MKLLIITQKVDKNDPVLGFFHKWIEEFSKRAEKITVISLSVGEHKLPSNVKVLSLGKEKGCTRLQRLRNFYNYIYQSRKDYDTVFVHMNPEYVVLAGTFWRLSGKKIALWYTHRQTNLKLWLAERLANTILTVSRESFNLKSKKVKIVGHGIDIERFSFVNPNLKIPKVITYIGRITSIKDIKTFIGAMNILENLFPNKYVGQAVGDALDEKDKKYKASLPAGVKFVPSVSQESLPKIYRESYATVNMSPTGGMDKTVLESLAMGRPTFASNLAFAEVFGEYKDLFTFREGDSETLAKKIEGFFKREDGEEICRKLSQKICEKYDVANLIERIIQSI